MKKLTPLFILLLIMAGCSVESYDSADEIITADARAKVAATASFDAPETICAGTLTNFCLNFPQAEKGNGDPKTSELQVKLYNEISGEYEQIFHAHENTQACFEYTFPDAKEYSLKYQVAGLGQPTSFTLIVESCVEVCAYGKGYWTNHGPVNPGNQENAYPEGGIEIGGNFYQLSELQSILNENGNTGDVFKMKQHLITALLNIANGVDGSSISSTIEDANDIIAVEGEGYSKDEITAVKDSLEEFTTNNSCE